MAKVDAGSEALTIEAVQARALVTLYMYSTNATIRSDGGAGGGGGARTTWEAPLRAWVASTALYGAVEPSAVLVANIEEESRDRDGNVSSLSAAVRFTVMLEAETVTASAAIASMQHWCGEFAATNDKWEAGMVSEGSLPGSSPNATWRLEVSSSARGVGTSGCPLADMVATKLTLSSVLGKPIAPAPAQDDELSTDDMFVLALIAVALLCFLSRGSRKLEKHEQALSHSRRGYGAARFTAVASAASSDDDDDGDDERQRMLPSDGDSFTAARQSTREIVTVQAMPTVRAESVLENGPAGKSIVAAATH